jgi:YfiH family protein
MLFSSHLLSSAGFAHAFPARSARDADLYGLLGTERVIQVKQVHGGRVVEAEVPPATEADAIVARASGATRATRATRANATTPIAVGVRVADCVPILLADTQSGDVAAVHAGWRGVVARVVPAAVAVLSGGRSLTTANGGALLATIGPCIGACCFEVGSDVAAQIARACDARVVVRDDGLRAYVDLRAAVRTQLMASGLAATDIDDVPGCTKHDAARFHSYRRDGDSSGRMLAAIATRR